MRAARLQEFDIAGDVSVTGMADSERASVASKSGVPNNFPCVIMTSLSGHEGLFEKIGVNAADPSYAIFVRPRYSDGGFFDPNLGKSLTVNPYIVQRAPTVDGNTHWVEVEALPPCDFVWE
ncbi:hypothetical protein [Maricaulis sp.]|uniref:hypothetical protein n=1 Tax=Maricaulis sp. TaxID=1486257 RepID=UPI003A8DADAA